ncbi:uncharacterized protein LOC110064629, partial [Orbicella faveolata]|uniref:uncharacterized protein LOC110064629 n=1 Tax=Orbicella faveolata TaxID=48498 RepID=UPI0009E3C7BE
QHLTLGRSVKLNSPTSFDIPVKDEQSFILTTDADVKFTHESVEALIDQIIEDPRIGAVCARTHPLGNGPVVWYQIFDYAIGHWFQKVANHMLGSVLCSPGCFSLYRCKAVREVLPTYATGVDHAFEFLTKDMGEDRWMCTLMVERGWRLTYCAAAEDSTYCPESFDELYKQRRRWTPSTLANLVLLVSEWKRILKNNDHISFLFILYQTFLVCSTVIGPSTVILVIVGGMMFSGLAVNEITTVVLISLVIVVYTVICLFTSPDFQLRVSKLLTFVFAVIMCIVFIGVAVQISNEIKSTGMTTLEPNSTESASPQSLEQHLPAGVSTLYLAGLSGIFIAAALLHPNEFTCLFHGMWYLLCLPSGYLLLTIYSLCNLTDRSWGRYALYALVVRKVDNAIHRINRYLVSTKQIVPNGDLQLICIHTRGHRQRLLRDIRKIPRLDIEEDIPQNVQEWLEEHGLGDYWPKFESSGYTEPSDLEDLKKINKDNLKETFNIHKPGHFNRLLSAIRKLQYPNQGQIKLRHTRRELDRLPLLYLDVDNQDDGIEYEFWEGLRQTCLVPELSAFDQTSELKEKLVELRNTALLIFGVSNALWTGYSTNIPLVTCCWNRGRYHPVKPIQTSLFNIFLSCPINEPLEMSTINRKDLTLIVPACCFTFFLLDENGRPMTALKNDVSFSDLNLAVEEWLTRDFKRYASNFREHGYDTAGFLPGMTDKDLQLIGIHTRGHRQRLLRDIRKIPRLDIEEDIPLDVQEWLEEHGLGDYWPKFESSGYTEPNDLEDLKKINKDNLKETFNIHKPGHFNRLLFAIRKLQYPNQGQIKLRQTRRELDRLPLLYLDVDNQDDGIEYEFWEGLRQTCLVPELSAFDQTSKLKEKLVELRNTALLIFGVSNALWMVIVLTLVQQKDLKVFGVDVIGLAFLLIYGFLIILQFLALLGHRFKTIVHILARTPWTLSKRVGNNRVSSVESENSQPTR